uniref:Uncharacterized protein n=1 Tax=Onchocerca volvulus TaxID=6282 RepID=A0A8R1Y1I4_ONCVO
MVEIQHFHAKLFLFPLGIALVILGKLFNLKKFGPKNIVLLIEPIILTFFTGVIIIIISFCEAVRSVILIIPHKLPITDYFYFSVGNEYVILLGNKQPVNLLWNFRILTRQLKQCYRNILSIDTNNLQLHSHLKSYYTIGYMIITYLMLTTIAKFYGRILLTMIEMTIVTIQTCNCLSTGYKLMSNVVLFSRPHDWNNNTYFRCRTLSVIVI